MITMNHDFYGPEWGNTHAQLSDAIAALFAALARGIGGAFERLHVYQFAAPWRRPPRRARMQHMK
jgi:hypothetical protein